MMRVCVLLAAATLLTSLSATAQAPDSVAAKAYQWYVGAGTGGHWYYSINRPYVRVKPVYLMGGVTISPKVSLQAEVQYGRNIQNTHYQGEVEGEQYIFTNREETRGTAITLLARFNRSRPASRLQFDWLLGLALVNGVQEDAAFRTNAATGSSSSYYYQPIRELTPHVVGGVSLRYLLGTHLALSAEALASKNLKIVPYGIFGLMPGAGASVGVSYRFGGAGQ